MAKRRLTRRIQILAVSSLLIGSTAGDSIAQNICNINGRSIEYRTRACLNNNCSNLHQKITFLGDKQLFYFDAMSNQGITFYDGRTVDLKTDKLQEAFKETAPPGMMETATVTSIRRNMDFYLTQHRLIQSTNGDPIGHYWHEVGVRIVSCNTCELILYRMRGNYLTNHVMTTFEGSSCRFVN